MQHASKHAAASEHPVISSMEPGENWTYCYVDDVAFMSPVTPPESAGEGHLLS